MSKSNVQSGGNRDQMPNSDEIWTRTLSSVICKYICGRQLEDNAETMC